MKKWAFLLPFSASVGAFLAYSFNPVILASFQNTFLTLIFTITTFSVMFSMSAFNSAAYRQFHHTFPAQLLGACLTILFVTLVPLMFLVCWPTNYLRVCLLLLPFLLIAGAGLLEIGRRETDPLILLDRLCSVKLGKTQLRLMASNIDAKIAETKNLELIERGNQPTHEFNWHLPLSSDREGPLNNLVILSILSIKNGDLHVFGKTVDRALELLEIADKIKVKKTLEAGEYTIRSELKGLVYEAIDRMIITVRSDKDSISLARIAIDIFSEFVVHRVKGHRQTDDLTFSILSHIEDLSRHCYENGSHSELRIPIIIARMIVKKGIDDPLAISSNGEFSIEACEFHHRLPQLTNYIKSLAVYGIKNNDTEFLYRCLDAFAWLGCDAVKKEEFTVVKACVRALSQLGREVRVKNLECFWDRCPVRPEDHAVERIDWIASWIAGLPKQSQAQWIKLFESAYSRFYGKEVNLSVDEDKDGKRRIQKDVTKVDYVEKYAMHAGSRDANYADSTFLKDLELHGGERGLIHMQGPIVPLVPQDDIQSM